MALLINSVLISFAVAFIIIYSLLARGERWEKERCWSYLQEAVTLRGLALVRNIAIIFTNDYRQEIDIHLGGQKKYRAWYAVNLLSQYFLDATHYAHAAWYSVFLWTSVTDPSQAIDVFPLLQTFLFRISQFLASAHSSLRIHKAYIILWTSLAHSQISAISFFLFRSLYLKSKCKLYC